MPKAWFDGQVLLRNFVGDGRQVVIVTHILVAIVDVVAELDQLIGDVTPPFSEVSCSVFARVGFLLLEVARRSRCQVGRLSCVEEIVDVHFLFPPPSSSLM